MRLLTLTEYCLLIFFTGFYLAVTGFTAKDIGLYIGIALIYIFSHIFSKRLLEKRGKREQTGSPFLQCTGHYRFSVHYCIMHCIGRFFFKLKNACCPKASKAFLFCLTHFVKREKDKLRCADNPVFRNQSQPISAVH